MGRNSAKAKGWIESFENKRTGKRYFTYRFREFDGSTTRTRAIAVSAEMAKEIKRHLTVGRARIVDILELIATKRKNQQENQND